MTVRLDLDAPMAESTTRRALLDISLAVAKCKKIVIVTGAGISCSCGVPVSHLVLSQPLNENDVSSGFPLIGRIVRAG